jgi:hypothetical protein
MGLPRGVYLRILVRPWFLNRRWALSFGGIALLISFFVLAISKLTGFPALVVLAVTGMLLNLALVLFLVAGPFTLQKLLLHTLLLYLAVTFAFFAAFLLFRASQYDYSALVLVLGFGLYFLVARPKAAKLRRESGKNGK